MQRVKIFSVFRFSFGEKKCDYSQRLNRRVPTASERKRASVVFGVVRQSEKEAKKVQLCVCVRSARDYHQHSTADQRNGISREISCGSGSSSSSSRRRIPSRRATGTEGN